jgi:hypothetical protein
LQTPHQTWLSKLATLNVARTEARGAAPHKPLMLLTVIDLIESGDIPDGWVKFDVRLVSRFRDYWELVQDRQRNSPDIPMPFNALGGDKDQVWQCFTVDGQPSKSKLTTRLGHLDFDLFAYLQDADFRREALRRYQLHFRPRGFRVTKYGNGCGFGVCMDSGQPLSGEFVHEGRFPDFEASDYRHAVTFRNLGFVQSLFEKVDLLGKE